MKEHYILSYPLAHTQALWLSRTAYDYLPKDGAANSGMGPPAPMNNQDNPNKEVHRPGSQLRLSFQMTEPSHVVKSKLARTYGHMHVSKFSILCPIH